MQECVGFIVILENLPSEWLGTSTCEILSIIIQLNSAAVPGRLTQCFVFIASLQSQSQHCQHVIHLSARYLRWWWSGSSHVLFHSWHPYLCLFTDAQAHESEKKALQIALFVPLLGRRHAMGCCVCVQSCVVGAFASMVTWPIPLLIVKVRDPSNV